jgi:hypothetical protein
MRIVLALVLVGSIGAGVVGLKRSGAYAFQQTGLKDHMSTEQRPFFVRPDEGREGDSLVKHTGLS